MNPFPQKEAAEAKDPLSAQLTAKTLHSSDALVPPGRLIPFSLVTSLFFLWGIPNNLNDVLIRQFMKSFAISRFEAGLVQSAFYLGYFLLAIPAALLTRRYGYKTGILIGLSLFSAGTLLFWPAATMARYELFLGALFVIASGLSFLETASNPFVAQIGPQENSERRLNFSQAFNPIGSITGVLLGTIFIFSGVELSPAQIQHLQLEHAYEAYLRSETLRVVRPYLILGALCIGLALLIARTRFPALQTAGEDQHASGGRFRDLLHYPHFLLAVLAQFMYVGAQVGTWSFFIQYVQETVHQPERIAGYFLTGTLAAFALGRFSSAYLMRFFAPRKMLGGYALVNLLLLAIGISAPGWTGLWAVFLTSFFMSLMFPTIFALGLRDLGHLGKIGGSLLVMAIIGGAVLTPFMGLIAEASHTIVSAYAVPLGAYIFVALYGFYGANLKPRI